VSDGFVEITGDHVAILADMAIRAENIEEVKAEEARRRAEARLAEHLDSEEVATVEATITYSLAQLKVKRRHPHK
jgi:F-type H+-transporting ATPase subunit epsilon